MNVIRVVTPHDDSRAPATKGPAGAPSLGRSFLLFALMIHVGAYVLLRRVMTRSPPHGERMLYNTMQFVDTYCFQFLTFDLGSVCIVFLLVDLATPRFVKNEFPPSGQGRLLFRGRLLFLAWG